MRPSGSDLSPCTAGSMELAVTRETENSSFVTCAAEVKSGLGRRDVAAFPKDSRRFGEPRPRLAARPVANAREAVGDDRQFAVVDDDRFGRFPGRRHDCPPAPIRLVRRRNGPDRGPAMGRSVFADGLPSGTGEAETAWDWFDVCQIVRGILSSIRSVSGGRFRI